MKIGPIGRPFAHTQFNLIQIDSNYIYSFLFIFENAHSNTTISQFPKPECNMCIYPAICVYGRPQTMLI